MISRGFKPRNMSIVHSPQGPAVKIDASLGLSVSVEGGIPKGQMGELKKKLETSLINAISDLEMFRSVAPWSEKADVKLDVKFSYSHVGTPHLEVMPIACITCLAYTPTTVTTKGTANVTVSCLVVSDTLVKTFEVEAEGYVASEIYSGPGVGATQSVGAASSVLMDRISTFLLENHSHIDKMVQARKPLNDFFSAVLENKVKEVKRLLRKGASVDAVNARSGGTALHLAAGQGLHAMAKLLLDRKAEIDVADADGRAPLHLAAEGGYADLVRLLLKRGASVQVKDNWGTSPADLARNGGYTEVWEMIHCGPAAAAFARCEKKRGVACYRAFIADFSEGECSESPKLNLARIRVQKLLKGKQACRLKEDNWIYSGTACRKRLAHGEGVAYHMERDLRFEGTFRAGRRIKGIIYKGETPLFDGPIVNGRPDGVGICFHEGEPEECKFYKGKRVDVVYKQRIEMAKQRKEMELMKKEMKDEMNRTVEEMRKTQTFAPQGDQGADSVIVDTIKKKATEKVMGEVFDMLF